MAVTREELTSLMERFEELGLTELVLDVGGTRVELTNDGRPPTVRSAGAVHTVLSPSVGIVHLTAERGGSVRAGDVVCSLEVWTSAVPVHAGVDGVVRQVHVADGTMVEYGQSLVDVEHV
jgi:acetyl/propionyl-CoA carboxylase alpha subunit